MNDRIVAVNHFLLDDNGNDERGDFEIELPRLDSVTGDLLVIFTVQFDKGVRSGVGFKNIIQVIKIQMRIGMGLK